MQEAYSNKSGHGPKIKDISGQRFNLLTVIQPDSKRSTSVWWLCKCDCGKTRVVPGGPLRGGSVYSCGCTRKPRIASVVKHGGARVGKKTPEYKCWIGIRKRCLDPSSSNYYLYGGRGLAMCQRWMDSFPDFLEDMGTKPTPAHSIDRIDNDKGYYPENCRWADAVEQANNKRSNVRLEFNGLNLTLPQWSKRIGINRGALYQRLYQCKWSVEKTLTTPLLSSGVALLD